MTDDDVLAEVVIDARSKARLSVPGEFSSDAPLHYRVDVSATNPDRVHWEEAMMGAPERYHIVIEIDNRNDSPALVKVRRREG